MSNATQHSQQSGDSRRRRSRGGKNRNNNQQDNRRSGDRDNRGERDNRGDRGPRDSNRGSQSGRSEEFRPQAPRRTYAPPKLTWWQKLLQMVGLYKAPTPPSRTERKPEAAKPQGEPRPPKSNIRNARTNEGAPAEQSGERTREPRTDERPPKRERSPRNADRDRPRGGDGSTVESPRVYVGNLSYDVSEQDLQELFKGIGPVRNVEIVYNRSTHRSKGYGFVEMLHKDEAVRSVEVLHDQPFMGRKLVVSGAKSKGQDEREDNDGQPEREPRKIVVAPIPQAPAAVEETSALVAETPAEVAGVTESEPVIQTIVENVTEATAEEIPAVAEVAEDLVNKYGFNEPKEETKEA